MAKAKMLLANLLLGFFAENAIKPGERIAIEKATTKHINATNTVRISRLILASKESTARQNA